MPLCAVLIGVLGAARIASAGYLHDEYLVIHKISMTVTNHLPFPVFGALILVGVLVNPLLSWLRPRWRLRSLVVGHPQGRTQPAAILVLGLTGLG